LAPRGACDNEDIAAPCADNLKSGLRLNVRF
jgi:hypothetical protein